jgi:hypothetical protein
MPPFRPSRSVAQLVPLVLVAACVRGAHIDQPAPLPVVVDAPIEAVARAVREELIVRRVDFDLTDTSSVAFTSAPMPLEFGNDASAVACPAGGTGRGYAVYHVDLAAKGESTVVTPWLNYNREGLGGPIGVVPPEETALGRCPSTRVWEADFAFAVKARAEGRPLSFAIYMDPAAKPFTAASEGPAHFYANVSTCRPAAQVPELERRYFASESEALAAGLRRSPVKGC